MDADRRIESTIFSSHALHQMFARSITVDQVQDVIERGEIVVAYPDDRPYPSELRLGFPEGHALHVVFAYNVETRTGYVVTAYLPDPELWSDDFTVRRTT